MRRDFLKRAAAVSAGIAVSPLAFGQADWPSRPITLLVPFPPGGAVDPIGRALAASLPAVLGQPVVVVNRPGANTGIATTSLFKAEPDGYTLLLNTPITHVLHTIQLPRGYDPVKGFTPIATVSRGDWVMVVNASVPANSLPEFIAYARANPDRISAGVSGSGNSDHLGTELFKLVTGLKITTVPYKGGGPALMDLLADRVQVMIASQSIVQQQVDAGKLRLLAYIAQPSVETQVPSFAQAGLKGFEVFGTILVVLGPPNMPAPIVARLTKAIERALDTPEAKTMIAKASQRAFYEPPATLHERLVTSNAVFTDIVQKTGIKFD